MKKKIILLFFILIIIFTGCGNSNKENKNGSKEEENKCIINDTYSNSDYEFNFNESLVCPEFKEIYQSDNYNHFFITKSGELYEFANKKYSTTGNNCRKVETDIKFDRIVRNTLIDKDGNVYSYNSEGVLKKITDKEVTEGRTYYGLDQMEVRLYKINKKIFYLAEIDLNAPEIYGYIDGNNIYSITYNWDTGKTSEELLYTLKDDEKVENTTNGFITTNKAFYKYGVTNRKECSEYEDIKCEYGLVLVDTKDNCPNIYYLSYGIVITKNMIK